MIRLSQLRVLELVVLLLKKDCTDTALELLKDCIEQSEAPPKFSNRLNVGERKCSCCGKMFTTDRVFLTDPPQVCCPYCNQYTCV